MEEVLKIGTLNIKNEAKKKEDAIFLANHIEEEQFDVLGIQELTRNFQKQIETHLKNYHFYGGYRLGDSKLFEKVKLFHDVNENNQIVTKHKVIQQYTLLLPFIPTKTDDLLDSIQNRSLMPRIVTVLLFEVQNKKICMMNTHLDYQIPDIQKKQLETLKQLILFHKEYPIILTGDFNMEFYNSSFQDFCDFLKTQNMKRVEWKFPTFTKGTTIDHIFLPNTWEELEKGSTAFPITDHKEIYVKVKSIL